MVIISGKSVSRTEEEEMRKLKNGKTASKVKAIEERIKSRGAIVTNRVWKMCNMALETRSARELKDRRERFIV